MAQQTVFDNLRLINVEPVAPARCPKSPCPANKRAPGESGKIRRRISDRIPRNGFLMADARRKIALPQPVEPFLQFGEPLPLIAERIAEPETVSPPRDRYAAKREPDYPSGPGNTAGCFRA